MARRMKLSEEVTGFGQRVDGLGQRVDGLTERVGRLGERFDRFEAKVAKRFEAVYDALDGRITILERNGQARRRRR
jgi:hypothetical protein